MAMKAETKQMTVTTAGDRTLEGEAGRETGEDEEAQQMTVTTTGDKTLEDEAGSETGEDEEAQAAGHVSHCVDALDVSGWMDPAGLDSSSMMPSKRRGIRQVKRWIHLRCATLGHDRLDWKSCKRPPRRPVEPE